MDQEVEGTGKRAKPPSRHEELEARSRRLLSAFPSSRFCIPYWQTQQDKPGAGSQELEASFPVPCSLFPCSLAPCRGPRRQVFVAGVACSLSWPHPPTPFPPPPPSFYPTPSPRPLCCRLFRSLFPCSLGPSFTVFYPPPIHSGPHPPCRFVRL